MTSSGLDSSREQVVEMILDKISMSDRSRQMYSRSMYIRKHGTYLNSMFIGLMLLPNQYLKILTMDDSNISDNLHKTLFEVVTIIKTSDEDMFFNRVYKYVPDKKYQYVGTYDLSHQQCGTANTCSVCQDIEVYRHAFDHVIGQLQTDRTIDGGYVIIDGLNDKMFHEWRFSQNEFSKVNIRFEKWQYANHILDNNSLHDVGHMFDGSNTKIREIIKYGTGKLFILERNEAISLMKYTRQKYYIPAGINNAKASTVLMRFVVEDRFKDVIESPLHGAPTHENSSVREYIYRNVGELKFIRTIKDDKILYTQVRDEGIPEPKNTMYSMVDGVWTENKGYWE